MYRPAYEKRVVNDLDRIPDADVARIAGAIRQLTIDPVPGGSIRLKAAIGLHRIRQGDCRILYTIANDAAEIRIISVKHRKEAYRNI